MRTAGHGRAYTLSRWKLRLSSHSSHTRLCPSESQPGVSSSPRDAPDHTYRVFKGPPRKGYVVPLFWETTQESFAQNKTRTFIGFDLACSYLLHQQSCPLLGDSFTDILSTVSPFELLTTCGGTGLYSSCRFSTDVGILHFSLYSYSA